MVAVVHGDDLAWSRGIGFANVESRMAPEPTTLYRIASITKTFTGTAIMQLRDEGRLHLDDPAVKFIPELRGASTPFGDIDAVTIRRMLSHESGLMSEPPGTDWRAPSYEGNVSRNLARMAEIGTKVPTNSQWKYSNLAFQILGEIVSRLSGAPYVEYVRDAILEPLGMTATAFEPLAEAQLPRRATGYAARFVSDELDLSSTAPTIYAEGGLWSCASDLARWLSFQFREDGGPRQGAQILAGQTLREMHKPRYIVDEKWTQAWGIAWSAMRKDDVIWVMHSGALHGFRSNVCFDPNQRIGAIVLVNGVTADAAPFAMDLAAIARDAVLAAPPAIDPPAHMPREYAFLLGIYLAKEEGVLLRLEWRDGKLAFIDATLPAWRPTLMPTENPDVFMIEPGVRQSGEHAVFARTADGRVASVFLAAGTYYRLDPVQPVTR
jgi:CubicO group peptidase (beta-lactamase class C family)